MLQRVVRVVLALAVIAPLTAVVVIASPSTADAHAGFSDTAGSSPNEAIQALADEGIVRGCTESEFCPADSLTRGQMASLIARALSLPNGTSAGFSDVSGTHASNIDALADAGITEGCTTDEFCPDEPITREQVATMIERAFDPAATDEQFFEDVNGTHGPAVNALAAEGIAAGCQDPPPHFCSRDNVSRAQSAVFLARALDFVDRVEVSPLEERQREHNESNGSGSGSDREDIWDSLAQCESGGNWSINTGNGYYGGLQFALPSWESVGGTGYPHEASREEQIRRGEMLQDVQGWGAWPHCSSQLGLR